MTYTEAIKDGFRLVNSRWQLVVVQAGMMLFNCVFFFILVGIPLGIAFIIFGLDLTGLAELKDILGFLRNPAEILSRYFGLVLILVISFLIYLVLITVIGLYVFGGSIGTIGASLLDPSSKFNLRSFTDQAKKLFFPLMWYSLVIALIFICVAFLLGVIGGGAAVLVSYARGQDSTLGLFMGIFFFLVFALVAASTVAVTLAVAVYGTAVLFFKREGAFRSVKGALHFLWTRQSALGLYLILFAAYIVASFIVILVVYPFNMIPIIGPIISFPFQIISYIVQGYLGLVIISIVFTYYHSEIVIKREIAAGPAPLQETTSESSTPADGTSAPQAPGQGQFPPQGEERAEE